MHQTKLTSGIIITGIVLGTAWAVRGQFGHEHGAAWAGGIGSLAILLFTRREDWISRAFPALLAGAIGWGIGGIMSYGKVVGFGRSTDFLNVYYGLLMLFVIGGLYGFLGGGLFGIALSDRKEKAGIAWHQLIVEMTVGAILLYFFLIEQFGWEMTPPRSELWAACLGMALAVFWYMKRHEMRQALRVALITGFGAGFGFAFGNFLQVIGTVLEIRFNFWNVMEYSLGFFGGAAMAYAVFTSDWPVKEKVSTARNWQFPLLMVLIIIPMIMWEQNTGLEKLHTRFSGLSAALPLWVSKVVNYGPYLVFAAFALYWSNRLKALSELKWEHLFQFFAGYFGLYIALSLLITGAFLSVYRIEQYLYLVNFAVVLAFLPKLFVSFKSGAKESWNKYAMNFFWLLVFVALLAVVASNSHPVDLNGAQYRFGDLADPVKH